MTTHEKIPYDEIDENCDRAWTMRLLDRLVEPDVDERELGHLSWGIERLQDPRSTPRLIQIAENQNLSAEVRHVAASCLYGVSVQPELKWRWWESEDNLLREWGFRLMEEAEFRPIIEQVASDPNHEFQHMAIGGTMTLTFGYQLRRHIEMKLKALEHPEPETRRAAANSLLWNEPVDAEAPLIQATYDWMRQWLKQPATPCNIIQRRKHFCG